MRILLPGRPWGLFTFLASLRVLPSLCFVSNAEGGPLGDISSLYYEGVNLDPEVINTDEVALNAFVEVDGLDFEDDGMLSGEFPQLGGTKPSISNTRGRQRSIKLHNQAGSEMPVVDRAEQEDASAQTVRETETSSPGRETLTSPPSLRGQKESDGSAHSVQMSALQMKERGSILQGIGGALLGSAAGTLLGGANQALQGPFALNTPQTNLTAGLTQTPAATAVTAAPMASLPVAGVTGMASVPAMTYGTYDTSVDTSHTVAGIVIGIIVGLILLCLIGGCVWKLTKKRR